MKNCIQCVNSSGGPPRAMVMCRFRIGLPGQWPVALPDWLWDAIREAQAGEASVVHSSVAQECDAFQMRQNTEATIPPPTPAPARKKQKSQQRDIANAEQDK